MDASGLLFSFLFFILFVITLSLLGCDWVVGWVEFRLVCLMFAVFLDIGLLGLTCLVGVLYVVCFVPGFTLTVVVLLCWVFGYGFLGYGYCFDIVYFVLQFFVFMLLLCYIWLEFGFVGFGCGLGWILAVYLDG